MTQLWMDGFDHYGGDVDKLLEGAYAELGNSAELSFPTAGARTGTYALKCRNSGGARRIFGGAFSTIIMGMGIFFDSLPASSTSDTPIQLRDVNNNVICTLTVRTDGALEFRSGDRSGTILGSTTGAVLQAGTWQHIEAEVFRSETVGTFELRVDAVQKMLLSGLDLGTEDFGQWFCTEVAGATGTMYLDDVSVRNDQGTRNNGFGGDIKVATIQPIANGDNQGWARRSIIKLSTGVMDFLDSDDQEKGIAYADNAVFEIGSDDFAIEGFVRFSELVGDNDVATIFSKWRETGDERSWRLALEGATVGGDLIFETSTDGTSGDVIQVHTFAFVPVVDRWYHFAVTRNLNDNRLFIDGIQAGTTKADVRTYDDNAAALFINGEQDTPTTTVENGSVDGWMDGVRFTVGEARYTANFVVPTEALPNDVGGDPLYDSVELLLNFDDVDNTDQSSNDFSGTLMNNPAVIFPNDEIAYQTIAGLTPDDNDYVEAELVAAQETLTFTGQPLDTETVVIGGTTYTFQTVLVDVADNVLIGVDADDSLANLETAVILGDGVGVKYGTGTVINSDALLTKATTNQRIATARTKGDAGNSIVTTETLTNGSWGGATLSGGLDIPTNSEFTMGALPADVTGVRAISVIGRNFKTDNGAAQMQMSYVHSGGASSAGADFAPGTNPAYFEDIHEVDPSTSGSLTPSSLVDARVRLNRTS